MDKKWFKAAGIRAIKTFAQTAVSLITIGATLKDIDWLTVGSASLVAAILSMLTSIAGLPELRITQRVVQKIQQRTTQRTQRGNMFNLFSFYRSKEWEALRKQITLERTNDNGELICEYCGKPISKAYDAICHHKKEITEANVNDFTISLNPDNISVVHHKCHNIIHDRFGTYTRHIYVVYGSPCSGKSTFVRENANRHDIIVDIDEIYRAISVNPLHDKSNRLTGNVMQIRNMLIDMIKTRNGKWINAWVITAKCRPMELERLCSDLGAEIIHIDTDKETCLARAELRKRPEYKNILKIILGITKHINAY